MRYRITWGEGLNSDIPPYELPDGFFNAGKNVRIVNGVAERLRGTSTYITFTTVPTWLGVLQSSNAGSYGSWIVGASTRVYAATLAEENEITPYTSGATISSATADGTTVTITTSTNHGRTTGDTISAWGFTPSTYNTDSATITVTDATTFTYTVASAPATSPATTVGLYSYNGTRSALASGTRWTGGEMGGVLFMQARTSENVGETLYYWAGNTSNAIRKVVGSYPARVSRPFGNYIVQLAPTMGGTVYPYRIMWSTSTEPGAVPTSFDSTGTNDAGYVDRTEGGECIDCLPLGEVNIIYKQSGRFTMEPIPGSNEVFRFTRLPGTEGLLNPGGVVDTQVGHVFLSSNYQVLLHTGGVCTNLSVGRVNDLITNTTSTNYFVTKNPAMNEVWIYIVKDGATYPTRALIWNWKEDKWGVREYGAIEVPAAETIFLKSNRKEFLCAVNSSGLLALEDQGGLTLFGSAYDTQMERTGIVADSPDVVKNLSRSRWNFDLLSGIAVTIEHGSAMTADATPTYATSATYTVGTTDYVNARATGGKYLAIRATWAAQNGNGGLGGVRSTDLDFTGGGSR